MIFDYISVLKAGSVTSVQRVTTVCDTIDARAPTTVKMVRDLHQARHESNMDISNRIHGLLDTWHYRDARTTLPLSKVPVILL